MNLKQLEYILRAGGSIAVGLCLSPADLAVSKLLAGREKDVEFVHEMLRAGVVAETAIRSLAGEPGPEQRVLLGKKLQICLRRPRQESGHEPLGR